MTTTSLPPVYINKHKEMAVEDPTVKWSYGVTTVESRVSTLLPQTLDSLTRAGFPEPVIFIDGLAPEFQRKGCDIVRRPKRLGAFGNWALALWELMIRQPAATYYALFQDDIVLNRCLKAYLESSIYPQKGYWNLFTTPANHEVLPGKAAFYPSFQLGRGALALIFDRDTVLDLLTHLTFVKHPMDVIDSTKRIDGVVIDALASRGYKEYIHNPSLVQHTGKDCSTVGHKHHPLANSFKGEQFDARDFMVEKPEISYTVQTVINAFPSANNPTLPKPPYQSVGKTTQGIVLGVEDMRNHTSDEGWQIQLGLQYAGFVLCGHQLTIPETDVRKILSIANPEILVLQDKREWDVTEGRDFRCRCSKFVGVDALLHRPDIFKLTVLKDSHQKPTYHSQSAEEIGAHAWIVYYHPKLVKHLAPYVREQHLVRTYHTIDKDKIPAYNSSRADSALISGAVSIAYPWRESLVNNLAQMPSVEYLKHPGYHNKGSATNDYLKILSRHKVAICTASKFGYALRKIIEATAAGCVVITDLPSDEVLPEIDGNLVRLPPNTQPRTVQIILQQLYREYQPEKQRDFAERAKKFYDYRPMGLRLTEDIESLRRNYEKT